MDCNNLNLKELMQEAENAKKYKDQIKYCEDENKELQNRLKIIEEFFSLLFDYNFHSSDIKSVDNLKNLFYSKVSEDRQGYLLAKERIRYKDEFNKQMRQFEDEMSWQREELMEAWEKFRVIRTKKYQQTLKEINEESI